MPARSGQRSAALVPQAVVDPGCERRASSGDFTARRILHEHFTVASNPLASGCLFTHGLVEGRLVTALWFDQPWSHPFTIAVFAAFSF
jgi:uncharacterized membrane protein